ncbi:biopolymer transporter ExbD [Gimesia fumaroli]|uniref:Biopolymer transport protein ExbD n=1 Tax=Gimesia fumaroli TaxID=2527976 RepID=A0A518IE29_9PLAN|nr:biopolymer transporter ExbD [Gimesia fumaroli]QDV51325.1 biopolymer transport protein ExbD [Gimesia fumaroli]
MPIKFYCNQCGQKLSVARKKAGKSVSCPACSGQITIPFESQSQRPPQSKETPAPPTEADLTPQVTAPLDQEQNQLLDDLDDLGPLGESWDEILEADSKETAAEETKPPTVAKKQEERFEEPEVEKVAASETREPVSEVEPSQEKQIAPPKPTPSAKKNDRKIEKATPSVPVPTSAPSVVAPTFDDEEEDEDDDDDGFSIRSAESDFEEMDLTPMVDVTFLLLIFFMITASFSLQKSIQVPPPNPDEDGVSQSLQTLDDFREESIIVEIDNNNGIYVDDTKLANPSEIVQAILDRRDQDGKPKRELVLSAHKAARHETVVAVVDAANEVGMQKIRLATYRGPED